MRRTIPAALVIGMLIALCLSAACTMPFQSQNTTQQQVQKAPVEKGAEKIPAPGDFLRTDLNDVLQSLAAWDAEAPVHKDYAGSVYYLHAENLDESGKAARWIFGTRVMNESSLLVYDSTAWTVIPQNRQFPDKRIDFSSLVLPSALMNQNRDAIARVAGPSARKDLDLSAGVYTLTISAPGSEQELKFDAATGAGIPEQ